MNNPRRELFADLTKKKRQLNVISIGLNTFFLLLKAACVVLLTLLCFAGGPPLTIAANALIAAGIALLLPQDAENIVREIKMRDKNMLFEKTSDSKKSTIVAITSFLGKMAILAGIGICIALSIMLGGAVGILGTSLCAASVCLFIAVDILEFLSSRTSKTSHSVQARSSNEQLATSYSHRVEQRPAQPVVSSAIRNTQPIAPHDGASVRASVVTATA